MTSFLIEFDETMPFQAHPVKGPGLQGWAYRRATKDWNRRHRKWAKTADRLKQTSFTIEAIDPAFFDLFHGLKSQM